MNTLPAFSINSGDIVAEIMMTRASSGGAIVLMEGASDSKFLRRFLNHIGVEFVICNGKDVLKAAVSALLLTSISGYIGIIDLDFDHHHGRTALRNTVVTETHDVETLLLKARLQTVVDELGDRERTERFFATNGGDLAAATLSRASCFARLRYLNDVTPAFNIAFDSFSPWKYISIATWAVDESLLHSQFATASQTSDNHITSLAVAAPLTADWRDVQGHDALDVLSIGLREVLGRGKQVSEANLLSALRLAFSEQDFRATDLYRSLTDWESSLDGRPLFD